MENNSDLKFINTLLIDYCVSCYQFKALCCSLNLREKYSKTKNIINNNSKTLGNMIEKLEKQRNDIENKIYQHLEDKKDLIEYFKKKYEKFIDCGDGTGIEHYAQYLLDEIERRNTVL